MNGKLCKKALQRQRHLHINVVQIVAFAQKSSLKHGTSEINLAGLKRSEKTLDPIWW